MTQTFRCGDPEALITYLYDEGDRTEGDRAERDAVAAHIARCASCADEVASLRSTRTVLAAWTPPEAALGFRMTREDERPAPVVLRPAAWWRQPLPAWAQAAAAVLIFAAGTTVGRTGSIETGPAAGTLAGTEVAAPAAAPAPVTATPAAASTSPAAPRNGVAAAGTMTLISRDELARLEQRLRALESRTSAMRTQNASATSAAPSNDALLQQVQALVTASEERQRRENILMVGNVVRDFDLQRRVDLRQVEDRLVRLHDNTGVALRQQNELANYLIRASQTNVPVNPR